MRGWLLLVGAVFLAGCGGAAKPAAQPQQASTVGLALFTIADFDPGWSGVATKPNAADCVSVATTMPGATQTAFSKALLGPYVTQQVASAAVGAGKALMTKITSALTACKTYTTTDSSGKVTSYEVQPLSVPALGDGAAGYRVTGASASSDVIVFRRGDLVEALLYGGVAIDNSDAIAWAKKADAKLR